MADTRPLPKNERARIKHKHASYSPAGTLLCTVCHLQLKSDSLWDYHLRSAGHIMRVQELQLQASKQEPKQNQGQQGQDEYALGSESKPKKRKASGDAEDTSRKRSRLPNELPDNLVNLETVPPSEPLVARPMNEIQIPSRPATPLKPSPNAQQGTVDEDEWAAFEADIAAAVNLQTTDAVISAPALSKADLAAQSMEISNIQRKAREEAEAEGDKEDAERKVEEEFDQMQSLEERVRKLREKRETLRKYAVIAENPTIQTEPSDIIEGGNDDDDDDDDEWDGFRVKG